MRTPVSVGLVGLSGSGQRFLRELKDLPAAELRWIHDPDTSATLRIRREALRAEPAVEYDDMLADETLDAVVIAGPPGAHADLVRRALDAGKHVLVEAPMALHAAEVEDLERRARNRDRRLMTAHEVLFEPAVGALRELIAAGRLGELLYVYASRRGLGGPGGESVLWGPGVVAVALVLWLVADEPIEATARGASFTTQGAIDLAACELRFATGIEAQLQLSALEPCTSRRTTAVGTGGMAVFDELDPLRRLTVYETARTVTESREPGSWLGDIVSPRLAPADALHAQCREFLAAVRSSVATPVHGRDRLAVVAVLEALQRSLDAGGTVQLVGEHPPVPNGVIELPLRALP
jgi:predicted dehydrogenase